MQEEWIVSSLSVATAWCVSEDSKVKFSIHKNLSHHWPWIWVINLPTMTQKNQLPWHLELLQIVCTLSRSVVANSCGPIGYSLPGSSVHVILQAKILKWVAISLSRGSSQTRDWAQVSSIAIRLFIDWATREAQDHGQLIHYHPTPRPYAVLWDHVSTSG